MMISDDAVVQIRDRLLSDQPADAASAIATYVDDLFPLLPADDRRRVAADLSAELLGLGPLQLLMDDPEVEEILVNAGRDIWIDRRGELRRAGQLRPGQADMVLERVLLPLGLRVDRTSPTVDARLADGSRVSAVVAPLAVDGTCIAIRRFRPLAVALDAFGDPACVDLLQQLVDRRCNVIVSGATSAGKTTLLNALAGRIPDGERIITIEDTAELRLATDHVVRLECRTGHDRRAEGGDCPRSAPGGVAAPTRPARRGRGAGRGGDRHGAGAQHRTRRLAVHLPCQRP